ncbi:hypothetical protein [Desulfobacter vibrioformis]|uniref:hypothetical protein n=1 Tax=Desulfobacter vibrioformis TaxID=34031 RepID=UPI000552926D|nr:hypothetical protein [Desulfobacter vibrioformis]
MFTDSLMATLTVTIDSTEYEIPAGSLRTIQLHMGTAGFEGQASFTLTSRDDNEFFTAFADSTLTDFSLSIQATWNQPDDTPDPLYVEGIVTQKSVREYTVEIMKDTPVIWYDFKIHFRDAVQVLWRQHFPVAVYASSTMGDVVTANTVANFTVSADMEEFSTSYDQICLALGMADNQASFYDFILWYVYSRNGVVYYDYTNKKLVISDSKQTADDTSTLNIDDVGAYRLVIPEIPRYNTRLYNVSSESTGTTSLTQDEAISGIYQDRVIRTDITSEVTAKSGYLEAELKVPSKEVHLEFKRMPRTTFTVGSQVEFDADKWYQGLSFNDDTFRVYEIDLTATAVNQASESGIGAEYAPFQINMTARMENKDNEVRIFPAFIRPRYPLAVEGTVVSETGEDTDKTYQIYTDDDTSVEYYKVYLPLWELNIQTRYIPDFLPGHFYFPLFRDTRVLVELTLNGARVARVLDWGDSTRLPDDYQGNHILFGKNDGDQTSMQHYYDESKPVLSIQRTYSTDTQLIQMSDESILLQTQDDEDE